MSKLILLLFIGIGSLALVSSCASRRTINLKNHEFQSNPRKIVWIQIAGLHDQHLALLRFSEAQGEMTKFEEATCIGKSWAYNLYELRPNAYLSFNSQLLGSKNMTGQCGDFKQDNLTPLYNADSRIGVFEVPSNLKNSLSKHKDCELGPETLLSEGAFWIMHEPEKAEQKTYHFQENIPYEKGEFYYDKSCQKGVCFSGILNNAIHIWQNSFKDENQYLYVIRDFSYLNALRSKNVGRAKEILNDFEKLIEYFEDNHLNDGKTSLIITSATSLNIEFPRMGKEWSEYVKNGKHVLFRNTSLISPVFAYGANSENFCGIFEEYDSLKRVFWESEDKGIFDLLENFNVQ